MFTIAASLLQDAATRSNLRLLRAGVVPEDACTACIQEDLWALEAALARMQTTSDEASPNLSCTLRLRADVERQQALSRAMISPIRRLPPEILSIIFVLVVPGDWGHCVSELLRRTSLSSSQVCHVWRTVALNTPWLRNTIEIDPYWTGYTRRRDTFDVRLARAGQVPLRLRIDNSGCFSKRDAEIWTLLKTQSHRWSALKVVGPSYLCIGRPFPLLTQLELVGEFCESVDLECFAYAPIISLTLCCDQEPLRVPAQLPSAWNVTKLIVDCDEHLGQDFLRIITNCSAQLRYLTVSTCDIRKSSVGVMQGVVFLVLETLTLRKAALKLLRYFRVPQLRLLELCGGDDVAKQQRLPMKNWLRTLRTAQEDTTSSWDSLRWLTLANFSPQNTKYMIECLDLLPNIQSLNIECRDDDPVCPCLPSRELIHALIRDPADATSMGRLPRLRRLGLLLSLPDRFGDIKAALLRTVLLTRLTEGVYDGQVLARLERFDSDLPGDWTVGGLLDRYFIDSETYAPSLETQMLFV
ncbi:uncharacterized protein SCHCODRAFT_02619159 [Schizophyllum commune H4-8]|nr:uncharacterized protein SCHCODRAFT_02619159 [Schizophyllum commune H4-8]KAI5895343.1 hypothetical protein SCHCODRAFT_02619159 [Schizophyllum commune H4-8]